LLRAHAAENVNSPVGLLWNFRHADHEGPVWDDDPFAAQRLN
jgi:hypothetical protein